MAHNVISCIEVAEITQTLKIADFTMQSGLWTLKIIAYWGRGIIYGLRFDSDFTQISGQKITTEITGLQLNFGAIFQKGELQWTRCHLLVTAHFLCNIFQQSSKTQFPQHSYVRFSIIHTYTET